MRIRDLYYLTVIAEVGNLTGAATRLNTVQSNLTARLKRLEEELAVPLFERHHQGVTPTPDGELMLDYAARILELVTQARAAVGHDGAVGGHLRIGAMETTSAVQLPDLLARYHASFPRVRLSLVTGPSDELIASVRARRLDGALVAAGAGAVDLTATVAFREELGLVGPASTGALLVRELEGRTLLLFRSGCSYRRRMDALLDEAGVSVDRYMEFGALEAILGCAAAGVGYSLLPRSVAEPWVNDGRLSFHPLPPPRRFIDTLFVHRRGNYQGRALTAFKQLVTRQSH